MASVNDDSIGSRQPTSRSDGSITVDLEDWKCALNPSKDSDYRNRPEIDIERLYNSTRRLLGELARYDAKATFFVLGEVALAAPDLVKEIHRQGHEIGSHSSVHLPPRLIPRHEFRQMLSRDVSLLTDLTGEPPTGFRVPYFDLRADEGWVIDVLSECGFVYDSSVVPTWTPYWGIPRAPKSPYFPDTANLSKKRSRGAILEIPVTVWPPFARIPGLPIGGGFYMRIWPADILAGMMRMNVREGHPLVIYVHPGDLDESKEELSRLTLRDRLTQYLVAYRGPEVFHRILSEFKFDTLSSKFSNHIDKARKGQSCDDTCSTE